MAWLLVIQVAGVSRLVFAVLLEQRCCWSKGHGITLPPNAAADAWPVPVITEMPDSTCRPGGLAVGSASLAGSASSAPAPWTGALRRPPSRCIPLNVSVMG
jgi:hypothetical protein